MLKMTFQAVHIPVYPNVIERVMDRFRRFAGPALIAAVHEYLGSEELADEVSFKESRDSEDKRKRKGYVEMVGKAPGQPLIFSTEMYRNVAVHSEGDSIILTVDPFAGDTKSGFDYVAYWQERTDFLGKAFDKVEEQLADFLEEIIIEELGFNIEVEM